MELKYSFCVSLNSAKLQLNVSSFICPNAFIFEIFVLFKLAVLLIFSLLIPDAGEDELLNDQ